MKRFPDIQTDLIFSDTTPSEAPKSEASADAEAGQGEVQATTEQPVPLAPQVTGVLEPISGAQTLVLILFGVLAFIMLIGITRYGSKNNYGD